MEGLGIRWGDMLFTLVTFLVLFWLLRKYAFGHIMKVMNDRADKIENDMTDAEQNRAEAEKLLAEQREDLNQAKQDAAQIIENAKLSSEQKATEIVKQAEEETERMKNVARKDIEREKEQAIEALRAEVGQLSVLLASKVAEKEIDPQQQQQLVDDYLKEVGNQKWVQ